MTQMPSNDICVICTESMLQQDSVHRLACGHSFHASCACEWFRRGNKSCPLCRDAPEELKPLDTQARAKRLLSVAKNKKAPHELKNLALKLSRAMATLKERQTDYKLFRRQYANVFKELNKRCTNLHKAHRTLRQSERELGTYHSFEFPLPPLVGYASDSDDSD